MFNNDYRSAASAAMALNAKHKAQDEEKKKVYYMQQLKKLVNKINTAEDLEAVKIYVKEQGLA